MATDFYDVTLNGVSKDTNVDQTANIQKVINKALTASATLWPNTPGAAVQRGGTIYFPNGYYKISGTLLDPLISSTWYNPKLTIRGDMPGISGTGGSGTRLILTSAPSNPVFQVHGDLTGSARATGFQLEQIALEGVGFAATWVSLKQATFCGLKRVKIVNTKGSGIYGDDWLDSDCHGLYFDSVSDGSTGHQVPSIDLSSNSPCSNLRFEDCHFANHDCFACWLHSGTKYVQFLGCNWFGILGPGYSNVRLDGVFQCSFTGCNFQMAASDHIVADSSTHGLMVTTSTFRDAYYWGIRLASDRNIIVGNSFATSSGGQGNGDASVPRGGNITGAGSGDINAKSQGGAGALV